MKLMIKLNKYFISVLNLNKNNLLPFLLKILISWSDKKYKYMLAFAFTILVIIKLNCISVTRYSYLIIHLKIIVKLLKK